VGGMSREDKIAQYSRIAAAHLAAAYSRTATPEQAQRSTDNARAAERQLERLRTGHIE
jgi:hypothetical protein